MKKTLPILTVLALTACDKPTTSIELECSIFKDWQNPVSLSRSNEDRKDEVPVLVDVKTYQDYAVLVVNGKESTFYKSKEEKIMGEFGHISIEYQGVFPDTDRTATFSLYGDIGNKTILQFDMYFDHEYVIHDEKKFKAGIFCEPTNKKYIGNYWSTNIPWNHGYKMPNKIEKCITTIVNKVYCNNEDCDRLYIFHDGHHYYLTAEEAIKISPNWDYSNMRLYTNDGRLEEYEKDACEVVNKLFNYIDNAGLNNSQIIQDTTH